MRSLVTWVGSAILTICVLLGGAYVMSGVLIGLLTAGGFYILMVRGPKWFRKLVHRWPLPVDLLFTAIAYSAFPAGLIGFIGAAATAVFISLFIEMDRLVLKAQGNQKTRIHELREIHRAAKASSQS